MKDNKQRYTVEELRSKGLILLEYISGSKMYGTNTETSDVDIRGIFVMPDEDFSDINYSPDWEEVESGKIKLPSGQECEMKFYELRKFLQMLEKNNPNSLEVFNIPDDCLVYKHPLVDAILLNQLKFLTKKCFASFSGYALDQTNKAHGKNKKQNWEKERFERKTILDFCYVPWKQGSIPLKQWFKEKGFWTMPKERFGLAKIPHMPGSYGIYEHTSLKGFVNEDETSTTLRVSTIPKDLMPIATMQFNENAWSIHCDEYRSYIDWMKNKNEARWVDVKGHNQKIDGKNMLHMQRLINMASDIADGKGVITRRPEAKELLKIRKGNVSLQDLLDRSTKELEILKEKFKKAPLCDEVEAGLCEKLNSSIRKYFQSKESVVAIPYREDISKA